MNFEFGETTLDPVDLKPKKNERRPQPIYLGNWMLFKLLFVLFVYDNDSGFHNTVLWWSLQKKIRYTISYSDFHSRYS